MKDMGEQLEDMSSELGKLRVENNSLKNRNTILEKVLALRDEHIRMLQDEQQVRWAAGWLAGWGGQAGAQTGSACSSVGCRVLAAFVGCPQSGWRCCRCHRLQPRIGPGASERTANAAAAQLFGTITAVCLCSLPPSPLQVFDLGNHYLQSSGTQKMLTGGASMSAAGALALGTTSGPLTTSEIKAVKGMPSEVVIGRWKETVRELGNILVQVRRVLISGEGLAAGGTVKGYCAKQRGGCAVYGSTCAALLPPAAPAPALPRHTQAPLPHLLLLFQPNVQIEGCPDASDARHQAAMHALCQVLDSAGQLCMHTAVLHPTNMQKLIAATLDDGRSGVVAEDRTRWAAVTHSLQLRCAWQHAQLRGAPLPTQAEHLHYRVAQRTA
jgi:hypothetical protein